MALLTINWRPSPKQLRLFGVACAVFSAALGAMLRWRHGQDLAAWILWGVSAASVVGAIAWPNGLRPLYVGLTAVSMPIGFVVSHIVSGVLYYVVLTPVALVFRLIGRDPLNRKFDRQAESYWIERQQTTDVNRYFRQF